MPLGGRGRLDELDTLAAADRDDASVDSDEDLELDVVRHQRPIVAPVHTDFLWLREIARRDIERR